MIHKVCYNFQIPLSSGVLAFQSITSLPAPDSVPWSPEPLRKSPATSAPIRPEIQHINCADAYPPSNQRKSPSRNEFGLERCLKGKHLIHTPQVHENGKVVATPLLTPTNNAMNASKHLSDYSAYKGRGRYAQQVSPCVTLMLCWFSQS